MLIRGKTQQSTPTIFSLQIFPRSSPKLEEKEVLTIETENLRAFVLDCIPIQSLVDMELLKNTRTRNVPTKLPRQVDLVAQISKVSALPRLESDEIPLPLPNRKGTLL